MNPLESLLEYLFCNVDLRYESLYGEIEMITDNKLADLRKLANKIENEPVENYNRKILKIMNDL